MTSLKDRTKFSTSSFDADKIKIETKEKVNGKEKLIYVNLIDKDSGKYIAFETLEPLFTPFGATSSKDYPDSILLHLASVILMKKSLIFLNN